MAGGTRQKIKKFIGNPEIGTTSQTHYNIGVMKQQSDLSSLVESISRQNQYANEYPLTDN